MTELRRDTEIRAGRCGYTVLDSDGLEQPCDRPATTWRWYQDVEHEDALDVACDRHGNPGGERMHALAARVAELEAENERLTRAVEIVIARATELEQAGALRIGMTAAEVDNASMRAFAADEMRSALAAVAPSEPQETT